MKVFISSIGFLEGSAEEIIEKWKKNSNNYFTSKNLDEFMKEVIRFFLYSKQVHKIVDKCFIENRKLTVEEKSKLDNILDNVDDYIKKMEEITPTQFLYLLKILGVCEILNED